MSRQACLLVLLLILFNFGVSSSSSRWIPCKLKGFRLGRGCGPSIQHSIARLGDSSNPSSSLFEYEDDGGVDDALISPSVSSNKTRKFFLFGGQSRNNTKRETGNETQSETEPAQEKQDEKKKASPGENKDDDNKKKKDSTPSTNSTNPTVITFSSVPPTPTHYRVTRPAGPVRPGSPTDARSVMIAELLSACVRWGLRLWIFRWWLRLSYENERFKPEPHFAWERLNDRYAKDQTILKEALSEPPYGVRRFIWRGCHDLRVMQLYRPPRKPLKDIFNRTVVVVPLPMDTNGNLNLRFLSDAVSFLIQQYRTRAFGMIKNGNKGGEPMPVEVVLMVESFGGSVSEYGLAAAHIKRLADEQGIALTVSVDQAAASGGYMIASQAHHLIAAPFATLGSIGVMMETLNFRDMARNYGITPISLKAGKHKNSISRFGSFSSTDERHENERLKKVHQSFQELIIASRPLLADQMDLMEGQVFLGSEALNLGLVDEIKTSDEYIMERVADGDRVLKLHHSRNLQSRRLIQMSPLDLLPHIRSWVSKRLTACFNHPEDAASVAISLWTACGFASHLYRQYIVHHSTPNV